MATEQNKSRWKKAAKNYQRFEESLETSVTPWVVMTGIVLIIFLGIWIYQVISGDPILLYETPR